MLVFLCVVAVCLVAEKCGTIRQKSWKFSFLYFDSEFSFLF